MSNNKQVSNGGYYKGVLVGILLTIASLTIFSQITGSINIINKVSTGEVLSQFQVEPFF